MSGKEHARADPLKGIWRLVHKPPLGLGNRGGHFGAVVLGCSDRVKANVDQDVSRQDGSRRLT